MPNNMKKAGMSYKKGGSTKKKMKKGGVTTSKMKKGGVVKKTTVYKRKK